MTTIRRKVANSALAGIVALGCTSAPVTTGLVKTPPHNSIAYASEIVSDFDTATLSASDASVYTSTLPPEEWQEISGSRSEWRVEGDYIVLRPLHGEDEGSLPSEDALPKDDDGDVIWPWYEWADVCTRLRIEGDIHCQDTTAGMFAGWSHLDSIEGLDSLDTSNVTNMKEMFTGCTGLTSLDVSSLDTSNVTNMESMFAGCTQLKSLDVSSLDTSNVTNMESMFAGCTQLKSLDVSSLDTSNDVSSLDTSNVTNMGGMFEWSGYTK